MLPNQVSTPYALASEKFIMALENSLDYHFYVKPYDVAFATYYKLDGADDLEYSTFLISFKEELVVYSTPRKYLKSKIKEDKANFGKSYKQLLKEKKSSNIAVGKIVAN